MSGETYFSRLCQPACLLSAWKRVRKKASRGGIDGINPEDLDGDIENMVDKTVAQLKEHHYIPVPYREFMIPKLNEKGEWRTLALPAVVDKIVQQAVVELIAPGFEKKFLDCSYAYRPGKGAVRACKRVDHILRTSRPGWVSECDIDDFFLPYRMGSCWLSWLRVLMTRN